MEISRINSIFTKVSSTRHQEDVVDRLNYRITASVLLVGAICIFAKDYGGDPIKCWGRAEWPGAWSEYAHDICFVENTYYIPLNTSTPNKPVTNPDHRIPKEPLRRLAQIDYYQWVPFVLIFMAIFFTFPRAMWHAFNWAVSGIHVSTVLNMTEQWRYAMGAGIDEKKRDAIARHLVSALRIKFKCIRNARGANHWFSSLRRFVLQRTLVLVYMGMKLMYLSTSAIQFAFMGYFLGKRNTFFGFDAIYALFHGKHWRDTGLFPRITLCDFRIRGMKNHIENYTVQCVLSGQMFNEKIFIALWWWLLILFTITAIDIVHWMYKLFIYDNRKRTLMALLESSVELVITEKDQKGEEEKKEKEEKDKAKPTNCECHFCEQKKAAVAEAEAASKAAAASLNGPTPSQGSGEDADKQKEKERDLERARELERKRNDFREKIRDEANFFIDFLGIDGILVLELIRSNASPLVASAVAGKMLLDLDVNEMKDDTDQEAFRLTN